MNEPRSFFVWMEDGITKHTHIHCRVCHGEVVFPTTSEAKVNESMLAVFKHDHQQCEQKLLNRMKVAVMA